MLERMVAIKVDREERPDVDSVYMTATQVMTEPSTAMLPITATIARNAREDSNARWVNIRW